MGREEEPNMGNNYKATKIKIPQDQQRDIRKGGAINLDSPDFRKNEKCENKGSHECKKSMDSNDFSGFCFKTYNSNMDPSLLEEMPKNAK